MSAIHLPSGRPGARELISFAALAVLTLAVLSGCGGAQSRDAGRADADVLDIGDGSDGMVGMDAGAGCSGPSGRTLDVLFIGNSQIDFWNMARLVSSLSESAPAGCPRIVGTKRTMGGANLRDLWETTDLETHIASSGYEFVVITESIDLADQGPEFLALFDDYARRIIAASRAAGATPVLYATAYVELPDRFGFAQMADPQLALGAELDVAVATGGLAWLRAWEMHPDLDLYHTDRGHPGFVGSYLSALVIYATLLDTSPVGLTNMPVTDCTDGPCADISLELAADLQAIAWEEHNSR